MSRSDEVVLRLRRPRRRKNRKLIDRLLRQGYTLRLATQEDSARSERR